MSLAGSQLVLSGPRSLSIQGACAGGSACAIDAGSRSRHFLVSGGAALSLSGVALTGGAELQGGSVLVVGGSLQATDCAFSGSRSFADGGALLGIASSRITLARGARARAQW